MKHQRVPRLNVNANKMKFSYLRAFSIPEIMIAIAVSLLLFYLLAQSTDAIRKVIKLSRQNATASVEAVLFFSRLQHDLENMPKRADISYVMKNFDPIQKEGPYQDTLRFMSEVKNTQENRRLSLVAYSLQKNSEGFYGVYRGVQGYGWHDIGFMGFDSNGIPPALAVLNDSSYDLLSPGVFRIYLSFLDKTGNLSNDLSNRQKNRLFDRFINRPLSEISSVIVTVAILDKKNQTLLNSELFDLLASKLTSPPDGTMAITHWDQIINKEFSDFKKGIPLPVAQSVRIYQKIFPLHE